MENNAKNYNNSTDIKLPKPPVIESKGSPSPSHRILRGIYDDTPRNEYGGAIGRDC